MKNIPIFFAFDNNYTVPAAVAFYSLLNKANNDTFYKMYVLHSDINKENQNILHNIVKKAGNAELQFIDTKGFMAGEWEKGNFNKGHDNSKFTLDTLIRCFAARFFPNIDKIIYSDVDIVVMDDISELYDIDTENNYVAGVKSVFSKYNPYELSHLNNNYYNMLKDSYIGGGIWLMNLKKIREDNIEEKMIDIIKNPNIIKRWPDQDIINIACLNKIGFLPLNYISYPYLQDLLKSPEFTSSYSREEMYDSIINPKIIHYAAMKPWNGTPRYADIWWTIFEYLNLPKTSIFKESFKHNKTKKYKLLFKIALTISVILAISIIIIILFINKNLL